MLGSIPEISMYATLVLVLLSSLSVLQFVVFLSFLAVVSILFRTWGIQFISPLSLASLYSLFPMAYVGLYLLANLFTYLGCFLSMVSVPWMKIAIVEGLALMVFMPYYFKWFIVREKVLSRFLVLILGNI